MSSLLKPWMVLAIIFIVGVVTGSALTIGLGSRFMHPPGEAQMKHHLMTRLSERLNLTADQQVKIDPILSDTAAKIQAVHHEDVDRVSQIIKASNDQISALLKPEQQAKLQKMESEREKMFSGHLHSWGPPRDGPDGMHHHGGPDDEGGMPPAPPPPPPPAPGASTNAAPSQSP
jgi:Spy/CpxP family protein refolding chaperone